jgi:hypothetical protein
MCKELMVAVVLAGGAAAEVRLASGGLECRIGPADELLYLGPGQGVGTDRADMRIESGGLRAQPDGKRSLLFAYRLGQSQPRQIIRLRGLKQAKEVAVQLDDEWRAAVIEVEAGL